MIRIGMLTYLVTILFAFICVLIVSIDQFKQNVHLWFCILLALNTVSLVFLIKKPEQFMRPHLIVGVLLFPLISFSLFLIWQYLLAVIPMTILSGAPGSNLLFVSLLIPAPVAVFSLLLTVSVPVTLIFGRWSVLVLAFTMILMMFTFDSWLKFGDLADKLVLYENLCLGLIGSYCFYFLARLIETRVLQMDSLNLNHGESHNKNSDFVPKV